MPLRRKDLKFLEVKYTSRVVMSRAKLWGHVFAFLLIAIGIATWWFDSNALPFKQVISVFTVFTGILAVLLWESRFKHPALVGTLISIALQVRGIVVLFRFAYSDNFQLPSAIVGLITWTGVSFCFQAIWQLIVIPFFREIDTLAAIKDQYSSEFDRRWRLWRPEAKVLPIEKEKL